MRRLQMEAIQQSFRFLTPTTLKAPFGWVGGKSQLAKHIVELMPKHRRYIEVFGGGLSVLYAKPKLKGSGSNKYSEVVNDINGDLINLHTIIKTRPQSFGIMLNDYLCSREIFYAIKQGKIKPKNDIQRAVLYYFLLAFSFGSKGDNFAMCKSRPPKNIYRDYSIWSERLKGVCIENMEFSKLIKEYDDKESLFYLDPPYVGTENYYKIERGFGLQEHRELCEILSHIKGKFILSYNDCALVRELYKDFNIMQTKQIRYSMNIKTRKMTSEVLIVNF